MNDCEGTHAERWLSHSVKRCGIGEYERGRRERTKAETEWFQGIWLGPAAGSSETLIGATDGLDRASAVKRLDSVTKWDVNAILDEMDAATTRPEQAGDAHSHKDQV